MIKMQKLKIFLLFISFLTNPSFAQDNFYSWDFYHHLRTNDLKREALEWLNDFPNPYRDIEISNKINFEKADVFLSRKQTDSANFYFKQVDNICTDTSVIEKAICTAFIVRDTAAINFYLSNNDNPKKEKKYRVSYKIMKRDSCLADTLITGNEFFKQMIIRYSGHKPRSPLKASLLSALYPGLGKFSLGFKYQAISSMEINTVLGLVLAESIILPASSAYTIFCITVSSVFYIGNVWGTAVLAKKQDKDFYNQIDEDISGYYYRQLYH
jgi:hypothetical protein